MQRHEEIGDAIFAADQEELVPRLLLYAHDVHDLDAESAEAIVVKAFDEVLGGLHGRHLHPAESLFGFLCAVISSLDAAQKKPEQRRTPAAVLKNFLRRWQIRSRVRHW